MTSKRTLAAGAAVTLSLILGGAGIAAAQNDPTPAPAAPSVPSSGVDMNAMHAQMPTEMKAQCSTMHAAGTTNTMPGGMMSGSTTGGMMSQSSTGGMMSGSSTGGMMNGTATTGS